MTSVHETSNNGICVETITLDSLNLDKVDLLKVNVEEAELQLLKGTLRKLREYRLSLK